MERWAAVCGGDEVCTYRLCGMPPVALEAARTQLQGARAIGYHAGMLLCASGWGDTLWQLDARTLAPAQVLPLGPGACRLIGVPGTECIYALCEDADSVMTFSLRRGQPVMLARTGVQPRDMALDARGRRLIVAGGAAGEAQIFAAPSLQLLTRVQTPGLCAGVAWAGGRIYTFSMTEQATGLLCMHDAHGRIRQSIETPALPGGLCAVGEETWAMYWGGAMQLDRWGNARRTLRMEGLTERAAAFPGGVIFCQPSTPRCVLLTARGAQSLRGGNDVCVYETAAPGSQ